MNHDSRAIANFFIDRAAAQGMDLTLMTLLKVLYFAHAWHLAKYQQPLVGQPFEAWKHGPVNRVVYEQFKKYGGKPINKKCVSFDAQRLEYTVTVYELDKETEQFLDNIFEYYAKLHPFQLSDITHASGTPWDEVWKAAEGGAVPGMLISDEKILEWFERTGGRLYLQGEQGANS